MAHLHSVYDNDTHFRIDPVTRKIKNESGKVILMQNDHNSERFTFEIPRYIDEHDMSVCNKVEVHFINLKDDKTEKSADVYPVEDLQISPNSDDVVICSWLISQNATKHAGSLNFVLRYACLTGDVIDYQWYTDIHKGISVSESISNTAYVATEYSDVLEAWRSELFGSYGGNVDLNGYATEQWVQEKYQPKGNYLDKEDYIDWFATGVSIPEKADLNNYKTNGKFYCNSESRAKTLLNRPDGMNTNFCMFVFDRSGGVQSQLMITLAGKMYIRSTSTTAWRGWVAYTTSEEIVNLTEEIKQQLQEELEQYAGFYVLKEGETIADAPDWAEVVVDPFTEDTDSGINITSAKPGQMIVVETVGADGTIILGGIDQTHGKIVEKSEILPETLLPDNEDSEWDGFEVCLSFDLQAPLVAGENYLVTLNGVEYQATAEAFSGEGYVTDGVVLRFAGRDIYYQENGTDFTPYYNALYYPIVEEDTVPIPGDATGIVDMKPATLSVYSYSEKIVKLPMEYLNVDAIRETFPVVEMVATLADGTTETFKLYGEKVTE